MTAAPLPPASLDLRDDLRAIVLRAMAASTGIVSRTRDQIVDEAIGAMEELGVCDPLPTLSEMSTEALTDELTRRKVGAAALAPGLERAAQWHDARCQGPSAFEQELHEVSAKALRHLAVNPEATNMQALAAGQAKGAATPMRAAVGKALDQLTAGMLHSEAVDLVLRAISAARAEGEVQ